MNKLIAATFLLLAIPAPAHSTAMTEGIRVATSVSYSDGVEGRVECDDKQDCVIKIVFRGKSHSFSNKLLGEGIQILPRYLTISYSQEVATKNIQTFGFWFEYGCDLDSVAATETACIALAHVEDGVLQDVVKFKRTTVDEFLSRKSFKN